MAVLTNQGNPEAEGVAGRRSTRIAIAIPITISGKDALGHPFKERARTVVINKHGAKITTFHQLALGAELSVDNHLLGRSAKATVVWLGDRRSPKVAVEIGIQLFEAQNLWGIEFPPEDWQEGPPIGPGGQRLESAFPPPSPSAQPPPAAASRPAAAGPGRLPQSWGAAAEASLSQLAKQADASLEQRAKQFEERLTKLTHQVGFGTQATLQDTANQLEGKLVQSLEQRVNDALARLEASRAQVETLRAKLAEVQKSTEAEVERTRSSIQNAGAEALRSAIEELKDKVRPELEAAASNFVEETRKRVQHEAASAVEAFSQEANSRLAKLTDEYLAKSVPQLRAQQTQAAEQANQEIRATAEAATAEFARKLRDISAETAPKFRAELEKSLEEAGAPLVERISQSVVEQAQKAVKEAEGVFSKDLQRIQGQVQAEIEKTGAETTRKQLANLTDSALQELQQQAGPMLDESRRQLATAIHALQERSTKEALEKLRKAVEESLSEATHDLRKTADEAKGTATKELEASAQTAIATSRKQLGEKARAALEAFTKEAKTIEKEYPAQLLQKLREYEEQRTHELEDHLHKALEKQRQAILKQVQKVGEESAQRAVAQVSAKSDEVIKQASEEASKRVGGTTAVLKAWEEQLRAHLKVYSQEAETSAKAVGETLANQAAGLSKATLEKVRKDSEALRNDLQNRLEGALEDVEKETLQALRGRFQEVTDRLLDDSAALLRKQAEENMELIADQLSQLRARTLTQAEEEFRSRLAKLQRSPGSPGSREPRRS